MASQEDSVKDFFISHNRADRERAEWIAWQLEEAGYTTALQAWDFRPGSNFVLEMQKAAAQAHRTIAILSPDYLTSLYAQPEWAAAFAQDPTGEKGTLLPIRVRECDLKGLLPQIIYIDLVGKEEEIAKEELLAGIRRERAKPKTPPPYVDFTPPTQETPEAPKQTAHDLYAPIREHILDASDLLERGQPDQFIGREFLDDELASFLESNDRGYFVIVGEPGIGKTAWAAHLVHARDWPYHFVSAPKGITQPAQFLGSICAQLIVHYDLDCHLPLAASRDGAFLSKLLREASKETSEPVVIVIDALDEAKRIADSRANTLYLPAELPPSVYFVLTHRPEDLALTCPDVPKRLFRLTADSEGNLLDVRRHLRQAAGREAIHAQLAEQGITVEDFVETLVHKSTGNFMYLHHVLQEIEQRGYSPLAMEALPEGLKDCYEHFWRRLKAQKREDWIRLYLPVISALAVVRQAVSPQQVAAFLGLNDDEVRWVIEEMREFLNEDVTSGQKQYRIYHTSFQEFLTGKLKEQGGTARCHAYIAEYYIKLCKGNWHELRDSHAITHLSYHLLRAGEQYWSALHNLIDRPFMRVKREQAGLSGFLADVEHARKAALGSRVQGLPSLARYAVLEATIGDLLSTFSPKLLRAWVSTGAVSEAIEIAQRITDSHTRCEALIAIAKRLPDRGDRQLALELLEDALELATTIDQEREDSHRREFLLEEIADGLVRVGKGEQAIELAKSLKIDELRNNTLRWVARNLARQGKEEIARQAVQLCDDNRLLDDIEWLDETDDQSRMDAKLWSPWLIDLLLEAGQFESAEAQINLLPEDKSAHYENMLELAKWKAAHPNGPRSPEGDPEEELPMMEKVHRLALAGQLDEAVTLFEQSVEREEEDLVRIGMCLAANGRIQDLMALAAGPSDMRWISDEVIARIAERVAHFAPTQARALVECAMSEAGWLPEDRDAEKAEKSAIKALAAELAKCGCIELALDITLSSRDNEVRKDSGLYKLAAELADQQHFHLTYVIAEHIQSEHWKFYTLMHIGRAYEQAGQYQEAREALMKAISLYENNTSAFDDQFEADYPDRLAIHLARMGFFWDVLAVGRRHGNIISALAAMEVRLAPQSSWHRHIWRFVLVLAGMQPDRYEMWFSPEKLPELESELLRSGAPESEVEEFLNASQLTFDIVRKLQAIGLFQALLEELESRGALDEWASFAATRLHLQNVSDSAQKQAQDRDQEVRPSWEVLVELRKRVEETGYGTRMQAVLSGLLAQQLASEMPNRGIQWVLGIAEQAGSHRDLVLSGVVHELALSQHFSQALEVASRIEEDESRLLYWRFEDQPNFSGNRKWEYLQIAVEMAKAGREREAVCLIEDIDWHQYIGAAHARLAIAIARAQPDQALHLAQRALELASSTTREGALRTVTQIVPLASLLSESPTAQSDCLQQVAKGVLDIKYWWPQRQHVVSHLGA